MKIFHSFKSLSQYLHSKVPSFHGSHYPQRTCLAMAPPSSNPETKKKPLVASDPSFTGRSGPSYINTHCLYAHQDKYGHLGGHVRCCHTGHLEAVPSNVECSHIEASTDISNGYASSSFENGSALFDRRKSFSGCLNDVCGDGFATIGSFSDDVGSHVGHERYASDVTKGLGRLSITGGHEATFHSTAGPFGFDELVQKPCAGDGDVFVSTCLCTESTSDVNGSQEMVRKMGSGDNADTEVPHCSEDLHKGAMTTKNCAEKVLPSCNVKSQHALEAKIQSSAKRPFCRQCEKVQKLCICVRIKGVVQNKVKITILQNPKEKRHAVGSARVALLGLKNVALIDVPEMATKESFRIRPKVPGSKRCLAGRGGKKLLLTGGKVPDIAQYAVPTEAEVVQIRNLLIEIFDNQDNHSNGCDSSSTLFTEHSREIVQQDELPDHLHSEGVNEGKDGVIEGKNDFIHKDRPPEKIDLPVLCEGQSNKDNDSLDRGCACLEEFESLIPPGVALLYPSDKAIELSATVQTSGSLNGHEPNAPCHLLVLDGTWSKARRIYFENPWLHRLPHYKLSPDSPSLYEGVRRQPKPGCLSTLESIVYALRFLEPDTEGLDGLLEVFDSMVEDQRRCKRMKGLVPEWETQ